MQRLTKSMIRDKTNEIGTHFAYSFPSTTGVAIGTQFKTYTGQTWIVGRIDNVIGDDRGYVHVEGYCIPLELE
jgi:hypothetical protein